VAEGEHQRHRDQDDRATRTGCSRPSGSRTGAPS
jgi:hypothetical protein